MRPGSAYEVTCRSLGASFLMTGVLGGYTTFSAFSLDLMTLWERGEPWPALVYGLASVLGSVIAVGAGLFLIRSIAA